MKMFACPDGGGDLFFDNLVCTSGCAVAYDPVAEAFVSGAPTCANRATIACNWVAPTPGMLCASCALTTVLPDLAVAGNDALWARAERAKRRVLVGLRRWGWFDADDAGPRPAFHMLSEATSTGRAEVSMGHFAGVVTINLAESDVTERVRRREALGEPYRTLVRHFRHEIAHFIFDRLAASGDFLHAFRALFGDETAPYGEALSRHYQFGPPADWQAGFVTPYASAHPHEDWAECAAHALHLVDMVDSFTAARLSGPQGLAAGLDAYGEPNGARVLGAAVAVGVALNHVNRATGIADVYPFVTPDAVMQKLVFAHRWLRQGSRV